MNVKKIKLITDTIWNQINLVTKAECNLSIQATGAHPKTDRAFLMMHAGFDDCDYICITYTPSDLYDIQKFWQPNKKSSLRMMQEEKAVSACHLDIVIYSLLNLEEVA